MYIYIGYPILYLEYEIDVEYFFTDTGYELKETYSFLDKLKTSFRCSTYGKSPYICSPCFNTANIQTTSKSIFSVSILFNLKRTPPLVEYKYSKGFWFYLII